MEQPNPFLAEDGTLRNADRAIVVPRKPTEYALNPQHSTAAHKAYLFEHLLGYTKEHAPELLAIIRAGSLVTRASPGRVNVDGSRFTVDLSVTGRTGRTVVVRTAWIFAPGRDVPRLTTVYVR